MEMLFLLQLDLKDSNLKIRNIIYFKDSIDWEWNFQNMPKQILDLSFVDFLEG